MLKEHRWPDMHNRQPGPIENLLGQPVLPLLRRVWPRIVLAQLRIAVESLRHVREPAARAKLRGQIAGLRELPRLLGERRAIQQRRRVPIRYLRALMAAP